MTKLSKTIRYLPLGALLFVAACNSSTSAVDETQSAAAGVTSETKQAQQTAQTTAPATNAEQAAETEEAKPVKTAKIIKKPGKVKDRGVYVKMIVNKNAVTNFDLERRKKFLELRREKGNRSKVAEDEMIEQIIKLQEAKRRNVLASDKQVNAAFANFAKRNRTTPSKLASDLNRMGVGAEHFKSFIKTQISWQSAVSGRFQAETINVSERDAVLQLRDSGTDKPEVTEYNFQQVVFVVPKAKRSKSFMAARRQEATAFKRGFQGCDTTLDKAKSLRDVSVIDRRRILQPELPQRWKDDVKDLTANQTSRVKDTEKGVEFIAICSTRQVNDDRAAQVSTQSQEFDSFNTKGSELSQRYLETLKSNATIIYQ
jgi:peptidyl-prolyl cis-trans isomerase SurA